MKILSRALSNLLSSILTRKASDGGQWLVDTSKSENLVLIFYTSLVPSIIKDLKCFTLHTLMNNLNFTTPHSHLWRREPLLSWLYRGGIYTRHKPSRCLAQHPVKILQQNQEQNLSYCSYLLQHGIAWRTFYKCASMLTSKGMCTRIQFPAFIIIKFFMVSSLRNLGLTGMQKRVNTIKSRILLWGRRQIWTHIHSE